MTEKEKVLNFLRDAGGFAARSVISSAVFHGHLSAVELDELLSTVLNGLVEVKEKKWTLTPLGWNQANQIVAEDTQPAQPEAIPDGFSRFKDLARQNPDASPQRLLQLAGRRLSDPLTWGAEWRAAHPEWFLQQPREWYSRDVELDSDGYPLRFPENPLTAKERETRPATEQAWFERAMRSPGASLEPLAVEMPAYECANILRVTKKVGEQNALDIFGLEKIETARRLAGLPSA